jgi:Na+/H+-dicarboxylate symporter
MTEETTAAPHGSRLQYWMFGGFVGGLIVGLLAYSLAGGAPWIGWIAANVTGPIGQIFLRLLFMLVIPLLVSALIVGVAEMNEMRALRSIGVRTLLYTIFVSAISVAISLAVVNLLQPGAGVDPQIARQLLATSGDNAKAIVEHAGEAKTGVQALVEIVPSNFIHAMSENDILAVMFFALMFGIGLSARRRRSGTTVLKSGIEGVFECDEADRPRHPLAPLAIFCFMFNFAAQFGLGSDVPALPPMSAWCCWRWACRCSGCSSPYWCCSRKKPGRLLSRNPGSKCHGVLHRLLQRHAADLAQGGERTAETAAPIARFVLTIGATANQNGTAMFEGVTVLFLAQFFGVDLSARPAVDRDDDLHPGRHRHRRCAGGFAARDRADPRHDRRAAEGIGLILGVDRFLDMCRTTLNVVGDLVAAQVISAQAADSGDSSA